VKHLFGKRFLLVAVSLSASMLAPFLAPGASAFTGSFAPGFDANGLNADSLFGNDYVMGSIVGRGRLHVSPNNPDTVDKSEGRTNDHRELSEDSATSLYTDMTWFLGYNYYRSSGNNNLRAETASDDAHTVKLGFALDLDDSFDMIGSASYQVLPEENFSQGTFEFDGAYFLSLAKEKQGEKIEGDDAESYYLRKAKEQEVVKYPAKDQYPHLKLGLHFMFSQDRKSTTTSGRVEGTQLTSDALLNMAGSGPYIGLALNRFISFKLALLVYYYDTSVYGFLFPNTTIGMFRPQEGLALADLNDTTPILLTYPFRSVTGSMNFQTGIKTNLSVALQHATYFGSIGGADTTSIGGILTQTINSKVKLGGQLDYTGGGGGFGGTSATGVVAGVTAAYLF
jgi:hypothetical protein